MNEWEFTADIASRINKYLSNHPSLPFSEARCEQKSKGTQKRRDLTLLDQNKQIVLTGEIKLPYQKDGGTPFNSKLVEDARSKAKRAKAAYFFTWNVNRFVLWETSPEAEQKVVPYKPWEVTSIIAENDLELTLTSDAIEAFLPKLLEYFAAIYLGEDHFGEKSPDERFIEALEASLHLPILLTEEELVKQYAKPHFRQDIDQWLRKDLGWTIFSDPEGIRDNLERASKFSCYALVNKLVFHEALLKRYGKKLSKLNVPAHIDKGDELHRHLEGYFADAKKITGDYETVFGEEHISVGKRVPFYSDRAVPHWRELISQIHQFDFSKLDYEVIGNIFERLISPEERRKYGQFYTRVEVVDLVNSFCIRRGGEKVMDPACGGGTFLVRAYARKKELDPGRKHGELLTDLFGVDIDLFAVNLTTINLATRDLIDEENYPQIARSDFFDLMPRATFLSLPKHLKAGGLGKMQHREVVVPELDAVVGNPPYIRQEEIRRSKKSGREMPEHGTKEFYQALVKQEANAILSGRSDIHCYFWPHALSFLKEDGFLCFLTSSQWLDVEYGFRLQEWVLRNFEIHAIFESIDEPWFVGARVATAVTILRRQPEEKKRMENLVRFVQLRRPIKEILAHDGTTAGAVAAANGFRDEILELETNTVNDRFRARLVRQGEIWAQGVKLGKTMEKSPDNGYEEGESQTGEYYGGKWGVYLRAPDFWFKLLDQFGAAFAPLGDIAEVRFGVKSGKDSFFFPKDCSEECLRKYPTEAEFREAYGLPRKEVASGKVRLVNCGEERGEIRPIEAKYLEPEVHSLMEIDGFTVAPEDCSKMILLVNKKKAELKGTYVLDYINWGESQGIHKGSTCAARVTTDRQWYDLTGHKRGALFWPMAQQYKHVIPVNDNDLICNHNLFDIYIDKQLISAFAGILNSSLVVLSKFQYGRPVGVEGNLKTEVVDVKMMQIPNSHKASVQILEKVATGFTKLKTRKALQFLSERKLREMAYMHSSKEEELANLPDTSELDMPDRRELDDAVLEMIGVKSPERRKEMLDELYDYLRGFFEATRQKEEKAIVNKNTSKRRGAIKPGEIAAQILEDIAAHDAYLLNQYEPDYFDHSKAFDTYEIPEAGRPVKFATMLKESGVKFVKGKRLLGLIKTKSPAQDDLIIFLARTGTRGLVRVPRETLECHRVQREYEKFLKQKENLLKFMIDQRVADGDLQEKVYSALTSLIANSRKK